MHLLGWLVCGVGYILLSVSAVAQRIPRATNGRAEAREREIASGVQLLVLLSKLTGVMRSISDYLGNSAPDNGLMHIGQVGGIFIVFARIKGLTDRQFVRGLEMILVHDLFESVHPDGDRPKYDRSRLSRILRIRLQQLSKLPFPKGEESMRSRQARYKRYLPFMEQVVSDMDPVMKKWVLDRFRCYYLSDATEARLARECDRLADVFLGTFYAGEGEKVQQFLDWAEHRACDPDFIAALRMLIPYYMPKKERRREKAHA